MSTYTRQNTFLLLTLLGISGSACTKGDPAANGPHSTYRGSVQLVDEFGKPIPDKGGVVVSVVDHETMNTSTDASGSFQLELPLGAQRLAFAKTGYGTCQTPSLTITASPATAPKAVTLGQLSTTTVTFFRSWELIDYQWYRYMGRLNAPSTPAQPRYRRLFFSTSKNVSPTNYQATRLYTGSFSDGVQANWYWFQDSIPQTVMTREINPGPQDHVYGVAYGDNPAADSYVDAQSGLTIYPALGKPLLPVFECPR